eukprot:14045712-Heterocapsa_arctica.AAC.1
MAFDKNIAIGIDKYCSQGSVYSATFDDSELFVVQMASSGTPNPLFMLKETIALFGEATAKKGEVGLPMDLADVEKTFKVAYQWVGKKTDDCDDVGWAKNRVGFYISGGTVSIKEFLMYFDELVAWRALYSDDVFDKLPSPPKIVIHVCPGLTLDIDNAADAMKC